MDHLGIHSALVTGTGRNRTTLPSLRKDLATILTAFSPRSQERPLEFAGKGEFAGMKDFEVVAFVVMLPEAGP